MGTTDDFLHFPLFSTALWDLANSRPVHSLMFSSHLFLWLPCLFPLSLYLARWFWPDLMNGRHDHTTAVCVSLQWSGGLNVVRLPAGSWHGLPRWEHGLWMRCVVSCGSTSFPWFVFFFGALLWGSMIHKHTWRWMWQGSASVVSWNWEKYSCHSKLVSTLSVLLLSVLYWRVSRAWNPQHKNWAQVLEACGSLKLLSVYFDLCVDATGVVCHQLGLLGTDLLCRRLWRLCRDAQLILPAKPSMSSALPGMGSVQICFCTQKHSSRTRSTLADSVPQWVPRLFGTHIKKKKIKAFQQNRVSA